MGIVREVCWQSRLSGLCAALAALLLSLRPDALAPFLVEFYVVRSLHVPFHALFVQRSQPRQLSLGFEPHFGRKTVVDGADLSCSSFARQFSPSRAVQ